MSLINKKQKEKEVAIFFTKWFNKVNSTSYESEVDPADEEADYLLVKRGAEPQKLQITMCDQQLIKSLLDARKTPGHVSALYDTNHLELIVEAVKDKCKYPKEVQSELTLLIYSDLAKFNPEYLKRYFLENCPNNNFKEIYLVELPKFDPKKSYPLYDGNIIKLK